jgi:hypothetical protein
MVTTARRMVAQARRHVEGDRRGLTNTLSDYISAQTTTLGLAEPIVRLAAGDYLSIEVETCYVSAVAGSQVTVRRSADGSDAAEHYADTLVRLNPRFTDAAIFDGLNDTLAELSGPLYSTGTVNIDFDPTLRGYALPDDLADDGLLEVRRSVSGTSAYWPVVPDYQVALGMDAVDFDTGNALFLPHSYPDDLTLRVVYKAQLGRFRSLDDDASTTGLLPAAYDLPPIGAAVRLLAGTPPLRADITSQGDTRRAGEVSTSDTLNAANALRALYQQRLASESSRLSAKHPTMLVRRPFP